MTYHKQGNHHIIKAKGRLELIQCEGKETLKQVYKRLPSKPYALLNGSFFEMKTGRPVSGVSIDGKVIAHRDMGGAVIYHRKAEKDYHINLLEGSMDRFNGWTEWALEAGPLLLPVIQGKVPSYITNGKHERTAIGLTDKGEFMVLVTSEEITGQQLAAEMKKNGCVKAINLDGGGSSQLLLNGEHKLYTGRAVANCLALYLDGEQKPPTDSKQAPILIIDPGHGGKDPGGGTCDRWKEKDMVLQISLYQQKRFEELGVPVALTRTGDQYLDSAARTKLVRDSGAQYCISNHINAGGGQGAEVIHSIFDSGKLANKIVTELVYVGARKRRVFTRTYPNNPNRDYYFMHRETGKVSTQIVEYGFADNREDADFITEHWEDLAEAVVKAFCEHIGHKYKPPAPASDDKLYRVQVGAFKSIENAELLADELKKKGYPATVV